MADKLASGFKVKTLLGRVVTVNKHLGEGGQGDVYAVDYNGKPMALKWYKPNGMGKNPKAFYDNIKNNVMRGSPSEEFLWPLDITEWKDGYGTPCRRRRRAAPAFARYGADSDYRGDHGEACTDGRPGGDSYPKL